MRRNVQAALGFAILAGAGLAAASVTAPRMTRPTGGANPLSHGMVIAVDPETGALTPGVARGLHLPTTIEEAQAYAREIAADLVTVTHADGSQSLIHDDRLADYAIVRMTPSGRPIVSCVEGEAAAAALLREPARDANGLEVE
jgi:hypothetical protein